jgi:hypothetical protein
MEPYEQCGGLFYAERGTRACRLLSEGPWPSRTRSHDLFAVPSHDPLRIEQDASYAQPLESVPKICQCLATAPVLFYMVDGPGASNDPIGAQGAHLLAHRAEGVARPQGAVDIVRAGSARRLGLLRTPTGVI